MNPAVLKIAQFVARRPSDRAIRLIHIFSGIIFISLMWWAQDRSVIDIPFYSDYRSLSPETETMVWYALMALGIFPLIKGLTRSCLVKHDTLRRLQWIFGILLVIIGCPVMDPVITTIDTTPAPRDGGFQIEAGVITSESWHPGSLIALLGLLWIVIGLTGKGTTEVCLRYKEVVKKIRV